MTESIFDLIPDRYTSALRDFSIFVISSEFNNTRERLLKLAIQQAILKMGKRTSKEYFTFEEIFSEVNSIFFNDAPLRSTLVKKFLMELYVNSIDFKTKELDGIYYLGLTEHQKNRNESIQKEQTKVFEAGIKNYIERCGKLELSVKAIQLFWRYLGQLFFAFGSNIANYFVDSNEMQQTEPFENSFEILDKLLKKHPSKSDRTKIRNAIIGLLTSPSSVESQFLATIGRTFYVFKLLSIDPDLERIGKILCQSIVVYLDTNVLIHYFSPKAIYHNQNITIIHELKELNCKIIVTPKTILEFKKHLNWEKQFCLSLSKYADEKEVNPSILPYSRFFLSRAKYISQLEIGLFFSQFDELEKKLEEEGFDIYPVSDSQNLQYYSEKTRHQFKVQNEKRFGRSPYIHNTDGDYYYDEAIDKRNIRTGEHDAYLYALVRATREEEPTNQCWCLTFDRHLPSNSQIDYEANMPYWISPEILWEYLRCMPNSVCETSKAEMIYARAFSSQYMLILGNYFDIDLLKFIHSQEDLIAKISLAPSKIAAIVHNQNFSAQYSRMKEMNEKTDFENAAKNLTQMIVKEFESDIRKSVQDELIQNQEQITSEEIKKLENSIKQRDEEKNALSKQIDLIRSEYVTIVANEKARATSITKANLRHSMVLFSLFIFCLALAVIISRHLINTKPQPPKLDFHLILNLLSTLFALWATLTFFISFIKSLVFSYKNKSSTFKEKLFLGLTNSFISLAINLICALFMYFYF